MPVQTVLGKVDKTSLGNISPHEHIFIDMTNQFSLPEGYLYTKAATEKVSIKNLGVLRRTPHALKDNLILDDYKTALDEVMHFKYAGGGTIVDVTNLGLARTPEMLRRIAIDSGLHIVMGCSYYYAATHPEDMDSRSTESITDEILHDVYEGVGPSGIKAGVIGEIAVSDILYKNEEKVIAASAMAQKKTGLGLHIHIFDWKKPHERFPLGLRSLEIAMDNGADPAKVAINHIGVAMNIDLEYCFEIAKRGAYLEFDNFGHEFYIDRPGRAFIPGPFELDINRVKAIKALCDAGYEKQILVSNDICHKSMLRAYGGWGYDHILTNIVHMFKDEDVPDEIIKLMLHDNPARFLDA